MGQQVSMIISVCVCLPACLYLYVGTGGSVKQEVGGMGGGWGRAGCSEGPEVIIA